MAIKKILASIAFLLAFSPVHAFDLSKLGPVHTSVIDTANVLNPADKTLLESKIAELRKKYTIEILTVIIPSTDGEDIASVATQIGQTVGVGKSDKDNGLVLLIAINDRAWNIATGYGMEWSLPDLLTKRIGEKNFVLFKQQKYYEGIFWALSDFDSVLSGDTSVVSNQSDSTWGDNWSPWYILQFIIVIAVSNIFFKPLVDSRKYRRFFWYILLAYIITLPLAYLIIPNLFSILENIGIWIIGSIFWIFGKSGRGGWVGWGFWGSSSSSGTSFWGGSFGWWGSSGNW